MKSPFSAYLWEIFSGLWRKDNPGNTECPEKPQADTWVMLRTLFMARRALKSGQAEEYDLQQAWEKINRCLPGFQKRGRMIWKYAAILFFFLGAGLLYHQYSFSPFPLAEISRDSICPGSEKAELILAGGERIILNAGTTVKEIKRLGIKLRNDDQEGRLRYEASVASDSVEMEYNTLYVPKGGEYALILPDGSLVWLNSETSLRFPVQFSERKREVYLNGEAYFRISKDTTAPFHVYAGQKEIVVLGTTFNVSAYENDEWWETTLVEGKVDIQDGDNRILMHPAEQYFVNQQTGVRQLRTVDPELYTSWIDGKFYFKAYSFEEIVKKLERWYDFTMIYKDESIRKMCFSGTIHKHHPIAEMLHYLEMTTDIRFSISGKNIMVERRGQ